MPEPHAEQEHHLQRVFELIGSVPVNGEHPDDFELSPADWERLKTCSCAHCGPGDGICPMTVQAMIGDYITERDDNLASALAPTFHPPWRREMPMSDPTPAAEIVHACPPSGTSVMPCCGRTPLEVSRTDRMTAHQDQVTCETEDGTARQAVGRAWFAGYSAGNLDGYFGTHEEREKSPYADLDPYREPSLPPEAGDT